MIVVVNIPVIVILGNTALKCLDDYTQQRKKGKNPVFLAKNIGLKQDTDYWK